MKRVSKQDKYHIPVLGRQVVRFLVTRPDGVYLDGTLGGGGHAALILQQLTPRAVYIGVDRDEEALSAAREKLRHFANIRLVHWAFDETEDILRQAEVEKVDGVLLDLGVSSHQIDADERGFAFRPGVALDMRMDRGQSFTAADILAEYSERELTRVFREYGEERFARRIANKIVAARAKQPLIQSDQLLEIIRQSVPGQMVVKSYARIFQALRIEVNQELERLKNALHGWLEHLNPGGRMVVISYHSLEDRIVKQFFKEQENPCICPPEFPVCVCGRKPQMRRIRPLLIRPEEDEIKDNPRARSAKMRVGEKL